jgi:hypothetical protein
MVSPARSSGQLSRKSAAIQSAVGYQLSKQAQVRPGEYMVIFFSCAFEAAICDDSGAKKKRQWTPW